jgi:AraC-like DNA-binding protein
VHYVARAPDPPLSTFVSYFWALSGATSGQRERIVPNGTQELVINLHEDAFAIYDGAGLEPSRQLSGAMVSGAYRRSFVIDTRAHTSIIGVHFKAGGALPFLGLAPGELADRHADLDALWGRAAAELRERLLGASSAPDRFRILEAALAARLRSKISRERAAVRAAVDGLARGEGVGQLAERVSLSRRRLIEVFTREVGMTPKLFGRVRRFQRALAIASNGAPFRWSDVAIESGYCDQSHMIRDFLEFTGASPADVALRLGVQLKENHLAEPDRSNSSNTRARPVSTFRREGHDETRGKY